MLHTHPLIVSHRIEPTMQDMSVVSVTMQFVSRGKKALRHNLNSPNMFLINVFLLTDTDQKGAGVYLNVQVCM